LTENFWFVCLSEQVIELVPGGAAIVVTDANKVEFVEAVSSREYGSPDASLTCVSDQLFSNLGSMVCCVQVLNRRTARVMRQTEKIRAGIVELVPLVKLQVFDEAELEYLICGIATIDVADWREHTHRTWTELYACVSVKWLRLGSHSAHPANPNSPTLTPRSCTQ
jgi:hypothetical protein